MRVFINNTEYGALRGFTLTDQIGNKSASEISVEANSGAPIPRAGDIIEIRRDGLPVFWGSCGIPRSPQYRTGLERRIYTITCGGANDILARRIVNEAYRDTTVSAAVQSLFESYIAEEGITLGAISEIPQEIRVYTAADYNLQNCLNELADLAGATWKITPDRYFYFLIPEDFPALPRVIDENHLLGGYYQHTTRDYKTRTVQYISGATEFTDPQTEFFVYDGETPTFTVSFPVAQRPQIAVNGTDLEESRIGMNGLHSGDPNCAFLFSYNSETITYNAVSGAMAAGDTVAITYTGMYPVRIAAQNDSMIAELAERTGLSGKREMVEQASGLRTAADALALAQSLLTRFAVSTGEITMTLLSDQLTALGWTLSDTDVMTRYTFDLPALDITGTYVVAERTITPHSADDREFLIKLRLTDGDYLRAYGETISNIRRDTQRLSVRDDDVVIKTSIHTETVSYGEATAWSDANVFYPSASAEIFAPLPLSAVYPI